MSQVNSCTCTYVLCLLKQPHWIGTVAIPQVMRPSTDVVLYWVMCSRDCCLVYVPSKHMHLYMYYASSSNLTGLGLLLFPKSWDLLLMLFFTGTVAWCMSQVNSCTCMYVLFLLKQPHWIGYSPSHGTFN